MSTISSVLLTLRSLSVVQPLLLLIDRVALSLPLQDIPSTGVDKWFSLEGRSENSKVRGQIHLRANLATREDRGISEEDNWTDIKQHVELLQIFIEHDLQKHKVGRFRYA